ncbi:MAG: hypothetical protein ACLQU3_20155 [Limisphaerales bacterium]
MPLDEAKAAVIYEAMRRRPEVQQAWLNGKFLFHDNGWQTSPWLGNQHPGYPSGHQNAEPQATVGGTRSSRAFGLRGNGWSGAGSSPGIGLKSR